MKNHFIRPNHPRKQMNVTVANESKNEDENIADGAGVPNDEMEVTTTVQDCNDDNQ